MATNDPQLHMDHTRAASAQSQRMLAMTAAVVGAGLVLGATSARRARRRRDGKAEARDRRDALVTYLREHLSGSDSALEVVERLRRSHAGTSEGQLFGSLFEEFQRERDIVRAMLRELGASSFTMKRVAATMLGGGLLAPAAGGERGELSLFRTLEALAIGVQGKRLLWRAMQQVEPGFDVVSRARLVELEVLAVRQWDALDQQRRALVSATFATFATATGRTSNYARMHHGRRDQANG
jgi:hypothetical protein